MTRELTPRRSCFWRCAVAAGRCDIPEEDDIVAAVVVVVESSFRRSEVGRRSFLMTVAAVVAGRGTEGLPRLAAPLSAAAAQSSKTRLAFRPVLAEVTQPSRPNWAAKLFDSART